MMRGKLPDGKVGVNMVTVQPPTFLVVSAVDLTPHCSMDSLLVWQVHRRADEEEVMLSFRSVLLPESRLS